MKKLIDYTKILRSKNAGPLFITFDLIFNSSEDMEYVEKRLKKCNSDYRNNNWKYFYKKS